MGSNGFRRRDVFQLLGGAAGVLAVPPGAMAAARAVPGPAQPAYPRVDHHQHLLSPAVAALLFPTVLVAAVPLPSDVAQLVQARAQHWSDSKGLRNTYTPDAALLNWDEHTWIRGRDAAADYIGQRFARPYRITPVSFSATGSAGALAVYFTRGEGAAAKHIGAAQWSLQKGADGVWRIAAETPVFPGPASYDPIDGAKLVSLLDEIGIRQATVLSVAYLFSDPHGKPAQDEVAKVRAENDWTLEQARRFPGRLVPFCSVNPLKDYALGEIARMARNREIKGLKLHFGNSDVDTKSPAHIPKLRQVFAAANAQRLAIVVHLWTLDPNYGRADAEGFLKNVLPSAPDVPVQIAHMAGGGPGWTDSALQVYVEALAAGDPRMRNVLFDVATVADQQSWDDLKLMAQRIRQIGLPRVLYGSDAAYGGRNTPRQEWANFRGSVPLSDAEFRAIANNVAPYLKPGYRAA